MLRKMTTIGLALGLLLPGSAVLAETAQEQKENQVRTEKQEMVQTGSQAAGDQERIKEQTRTRDQDKDQTRDRDRLREHPGSGTQTRSGGR